MDQKKIKEILARECGALRECKKIIKKNNLEPIFVSLTETPTTIMKGMFKRHGSKVYANSIHIGEIKEDRLVIFDPVKLQKALQ